MNKYTYIALLRIFLGIAFLSAVADRFGFYGEIGNPNIAWGNMENFIQYTALVNSFLPQSFSPFLGWTATILEIILGITLISGYRVQLVSRISAMLLFAFAFAMSVSFGVKSSLDYSVFLAGLAAIRNFFILSYENKHMFSIDTLLKKNES